MCTRRMNKYSHMMMFSGIFSPLLTMNWFRPPRGGWWYACLACLFEYSPFQLRIKKSSWWDCELLFPVWLHFWPHAAFYTPPVLRYGACFFFNYPRKEYSCYNSYYRDDVEPTSYIIGIMGMNFNSWLERCVSFWTVIKNERYAIAV